MFGEEGNDLTFDEELNDGQIHDIDINGTDVAGRKIHAKVRADLQGARQAWREHNAITAAEMREAERKRKPARLGIDEGPDRSGSGSGRLTGSALARDLLSRPGR